MRASQSDPHIETYGSGKRLLFREEAALQCALRRLEADGRVLVFSHGRNWFDDRAQYPFYAYVTRGANREPLTKQHIDYLRGVLERGAASIAGSVASAPESAGLAPEVDGAAPSVPVSPQAPPAAVDQASLNACVAPLLADLEQRLHTHITLTLTALVDKVADVAEGQQALRSALQEVADSAKMRHLEDRLKQKQADHDEALQLIKVAEEERDDRIRELDHVHRELDKLALENDRLRASKARDAFDLPTDLPEMIALLQSWYPDRVLFHQRAVNDAKARSTQHLKNIKTVKRVWSILQSIPTTLHGLVFLDGSSRLEQAYKEATGFELALREGEQTNDDPKLMAHRRVEYQGETVECREHLKLGPDLRVHIHFDRARRLILVGRCGGHLPTASTRRRH